MMLTEQGKAMKCQLSPDGKQVFLEIDPEEAIRQRPNADAICYVLEQNGYKEFHYLWDAIDELVKKDYHSAAGPIHKVVAEKRDASIEVTLSEDEMTAWLQVQPAQGGAPPTLVSLQNTLMAAGVLYGIRMDILEVCVAEGSLEKTIVAEGVQVEHGQPAYFEYLIREQPEEQAPQEREDGSIDYYELNIVKTVMPNEPLLKKYPPTPGIDGMTVTGHQIKADPGKNYHLAESAGSAIAEEDHNLLIATRAGKPVWNKYTVKVDEVFTLDEVGVETGNIRFGGSVVVRGNVNNGFKVEAGGDITVNGSVEGAILQAGSNIEIRGGFFGHGGAYMLARRNIKAKFIQNAKIECEGDLLVSDGLFHCDVRAGRSVQVGINGGKGHINGGKVSAMELIKARLLGSPSSTVCHLSVGLQPQHRDTLNMLEQERTHLKSQLEETIKALIYIRTKALATKSEEIPELEEKRNQLSNQVNGFNEKINDLRLALESTIPIGKIMATNKVFAGVKLTVGELRKNIDEDLASCLFSFRNSKNGPEIVLGPLLKSDFEFPKS